MKTLLLLAVIMAVGKNLTSGHKRHSPGGGTLSSPLPFPRIWPSLSEVRARGVAGRGGGATGSQAPSLAAAVLPGPAAGPWKFAGFPEMIKFATGKEAATNYSFYGCYCGMRAEETPRMNRSVRATPQPSLCPLVAPGGQELESSCYPICTEPQEVLAEKAAVTFGHSALDCTNVRGSLPRAQA